MTNMYLYTVSALIAAAVLGLVIALRSKKERDRSYTALDKAGRVTNILLLILYLCAMPFVMLLGMISAPAHGGAAGLLGWIAAVVIASAPLPCGVGLGLSVALRKKGKSRLSFAMQFLGVAGIALSFVLYALLEGVLLSTLN